MKMRCFQVFFGAAIWILSTPNTYAAISINTNDPDEWTCPAAADINKDGGFSESDIIVWMQDPDKRVDIDQDGDIDDLDRNRIAKCIGRIFSPKSTPTPTPAPTPTRSPVNPRSGNAPRLK